MLPRRVDGLAVDLLVGAGHHEVAGRIEDHHRLGAAIEHVDAILRVDGEARDAGLIGRAARVLRGRALTAHRAASRRLRFALGRRRRRVLQAEEHAGRQLRPVRHQLVSTVTGLRVRDQSRRRRSMSAASEVASGCRIYFLLKRRHPSTVTQLPRIARQGRTIHHESDSSLRRSCCCWPRPPSRRHRLRRRQALSRYPRGRCRRSAVRPRAATSFRRLDFDEYFLGKWTFEWTMPDSQLGPGGDLTGTTIVTKLDGRFYEAVTEGKGPGGAFKARELWAYHRENKTLARQVTDSQRLQLPAVRHRSVATSAESTTCCSTARRSRPTASPCACARPSACCRRSTIASPCRCRWTAVRSPTSAIRGGGRISVTSGKGQ